MCTLLVAALCVSVLELDPYPAEQAVACGLWFCGRLRHLLLAGVRAACGGGGLLYSRAGAGSGSVAGCVWRCGQLKLHVARVGW